MPTFDLEYLKKEINFPNFVEENLIRIEDNKCYKQLIFELKDKFYEIMFCNQVDRHEDYDDYFSIICEGKVPCTEVEKFEVTSHIWKSKDSIEQLNKQIEQMREDIVNELKDFPLTKLENITIMFGNKHKGKSVRQVYIQDKEFIKWIKNNPPTYNSFNKYVQEKERSRLALILYMESIEYLGFQGY